MPSIDWNSVSMTKGQVHLSQLFLDTMRDTYLYQHITQPTRHRHGQNANILDLVITNGEDMINNLEYCLGLGMSDHLCISFKLIVHTEPDAKADPKFRYHKGDYDGLKTVYRK